MTSRQLEQRGTLFYGQVELNLLANYEAGDVISIDDHLFVEVVDRVEKADGIFVLGMIPRPLMPRPACLCMLFTHYYRHYGRDMVDHVRTVKELKRPSELVQRLTESALRDDLFERSIGSALAYSLPKVKYL